MKTVYINTKIRTTDDEAKKQFIIYLNNEEGKNEIKEYINALRTVFAREDRDFQKLTVVEVHSEKTVSEYFSINNFE